MNLCASACREMWIMCAPCGSATCSCALLTTRRLSAAPVLCYYTHSRVHRALCLQANFIRYRDFTVVYRRYASLFFMMGVDNGQVRSNRMSYSACNVPPPEHVRSAQRVPQTQAWMPVCMSAHISCWLTSVPA